MTVESKDLDQAIRALKRTDADEAAAESFRKSTPEVVKDARSNLASRNGGGTYPRRRGMITEDRDGVRLNVGGTYPWAKGAEFGANSVWVFGRRLPASSARRRQFAPWSGAAFTIKGRTGHLIGDAIRENVDDMADEAVEAVADEYVANLKKAGVPARG